MTALTMIISLSVIVATTMFCFNRMGLGLLSALLIGIVAGMLGGSILETGAFAAAGSTDVLVLGVLLAPVFALVLGTETSSESNPSLLIVESAIRANRAAPAEFGIAITVPNETRIPVRAA